MSDINQIEFMGIDMGNFYYGIELDDVKEIARELRITPVPCLPDYYEGVCNWKGRIIPVVSIQRAGALAMPLSERDNIQPLILITQSSGLECGFLIPGEPGIVNVTADGQLKGELPENRESVLMVKQAYEGEDKVVLVIDLGESLERMMVYE